MASNCITEDEENGLRLQLLLTAMEQVLRDRFYKHLQLNNIRINQFFNENEEKLWKQKKFRRKRNDRDVEKFDFSALAILLRECCGFKPPFRGWVLEESDRSEFANFERFQITRNKIQHSLIPVCQKEFHDIFYFVKQAMLDFQYPVEKIEYIKNCQIDYSSKKKIDESSSINFSYKFTKPITNFLGREEEITKIHKYLESTTENEKYGVVVHGLPGVGKTELTRKYWTKYSNYYKGGILWINAQTNESIEASFADIANQAGLTTIDRNGDSVQTKEITRETYKYFKYGIEGDVLFVFDNALNIQQLNPFLPWENCEPFVVITSHSKTRIRITIFD